jgi:hypothetical protein
MQQHNGHVFVNERNRKHIAYKCVRSFKIQKVLINDPLIEFSEELADK